jgi:predicted permease
VRRRERMMADLDEDIRNHIETETQHNIARGTSPEEARRTALLKFGSVTRVQEDARNGWSVIWLEQLLQDLRYGLRMLRKSPGVTTVVVIALALGVGANVAIFSIVNGFLLRPLPVRSPEQITILAIQEKDAPVGSSGFSYPEFVDFRAQAGAFSDVFGLILSSVQVAHDERSEQSFANYVSENFFSSLDLTPAQGRLILPSDGETAGEQTFAVLDYLYWQRRFNGDSRVVGRQIRINGGPATIIGVAPREFHGMFPIFETDIYLSMTAISAEEGAKAFWSSRDRRRILAFGRLKPGVSISHAQSSLDVISAQLAKQYPATDRWFTVRAVPEKSARPIPYANRSFVAISGLFLALAAMVLLLACMNVENILLARGTTRQREMGVRAALGAGRARLTAQMLTESVILAGLGGGAGAVLGVWANHWTNSIHLQNIPLQLDASLDWRVFAFAAVLVVFAGIVVGSVPALRASSADVNVVLHDGAQGKPFGVSQSGLRNFLVVAQVAGSLVLLVSAGLFLRSLLKVEQFDLGFDPDHVLNVVIDPHEIGYDEARTTVLYREVETKVRAIPGVQSVSVASYIPMGGFPTGTTVSIEGRSTLPGQQAPRVLYNAVDPDYFATMRIGLLRGRGFADSDSESSPRVAIVNQTMAARFWPREDAIGKRFRMNGETGPFAEVVGVTRDGKYQTVGEDAQAFFYLPVAQNFASKRALQIRTAADPESLVGPVKEIISREAPGLSVGDIETMKQFLEGALGFFAFRLAATLAGALGVIGLFLAVVGVYGVVSFSVSQRTREIGIRMALGAGPGEVVRFVWLQGGRLILAGVAIGVPAAWVLSRTMTHLMAGISASDPVTYVTVAVVLAAVALLACYIPARRAMRVDPMVALRYE